MYHILAPQCHRQDSAALRENHPLSLAAADAPALVHPPAAVLARIEGVEQEMDLAGSRGRFDLVSTVDQIAGARLHPETVERGLAQRLLGSLAEIGGHPQIARLEGALERGLELALGIGLVEPGARDADPRAAARRAGANVGRDLAVGREGKPDQLVLAALATREDARPLR